MKTVFRKKLASTASERGRLHPALPVEGATQAPTIDEFGKDPHLVESLRPFFQFLYYSYFRVEVKGARNIPGEGRALIVANHSGALPLDGTMVNLAVFNEHPASRDVRFLVEDFVYHFPFLGNFISRTGGVRASPENAEQLLLHDKLVAVFPEGIKGIGKVYSKRYRLQRFGRGGYLRIAIRTGSKIIPTAIVGAEETYPILWKTTVLAKPLGLPYIPITPTFPFLGLLGLIPLPSKWDILFGPPLDCGQYNPAEADNDLLIHKLNQKIRRKIQAMIDEELKRRKRDI